MRRMIPTRMIDWIKELEEVVKSNGSNVEIDGNLKINGELEDVLELEWTDKYETVRHVRFLILKTQYIYQHSTQYIGLAYGINDLISMMICTLDYYSNEKFYLYGIATGEDVGNTFVELDVENGVSRGDYLSDAIVTSSTYHRYVKIFTHSILIKGSGGSIAFNINAFHSNPFDSVEDLYNILKNDKLAVFGVYGTSNTSIYFVDWNNRITDATINDTTTTLVSAIGTVLSIKDYVQEIV